MLEEPRWLLALAELPLRPLEPPPKPPPLEPVLGLGDTLRLPTRSPPPRRGRFPRRLPRRLHDCSHPAAKRRLDEPVSNHLRQNINNANQKAKGRPVGRSFIVFMSPRPRLKISSANPITIRPICVSVRVRPDRESSRSPRQPKYPPIRAWAAACVHFVRGLRVAMWITPRRR